MIDPETLAALETHVTVRLAVIPKARFRELAGPHGGDTARRRLAQELAASLAAPFDVRPAAPSTSAPTIPGPTDGRKSWAE